VIGEAHASYEPQLETEFGGQGRDEFVATKGATMTLAPAEVNPTDQAQGDHWIIDKLRKMFEELAEVKVITVVGNVTVALPPAAGGRATVDAGQAPMSDAIVTMFNLIDGDVTNVIAPSLKDDAAMRAFHATQVEKSMAVLPSNIAALVNFAKALIHDLKA